MTNRQFDDAMRRLTTHILDVEAMKRARDRADVWNFTANKFENAVSGTFALAALTPGGTQGSVTVEGGVVTEITPPT
jgi:hypothetical protein